MNCIICGNEIDLDDYVEVSNAYIERYHPDRLESGGRVIGSWQVSVHFECVERHESVDTASLARWAGRRVMHERQKREALEKKVNDELALIHRALHALPPAMVEAYIAELYFADEAQSRQKADGHV